MIKIKFNTQNHTLKYTTNESERLFSDVTTIKVHDGYYEILQKQMTGSSAPLLRVPINNTVIEYSHVDDLYDID